MSSASAPDESAPVVLHDVSDTGLLLESAVSLTLGEDLDVILPRQGARSVTVAWASGRFFGCQFTQGAVAEALDPAPGGMNSLPAKGSPEAVSMAAAQLHELSMAIERISRVLDRAMDQLSKRER